ncbi:MAG: hypothetical protein DLM66_04490 [Candidatus Dormiibacter spiritus]|nr:MAG: hypothetical protein DLM66_04490 [Candidatus Dormibacteraeota bacterium]
MIRAICGYVSVKAMARIEDANTDIGRLELETRRRHIEQSRQGQLIRATDEMIAELEELNVRGSDRVPAALRRHAEAVLSALPPTEEPLEARYRVDAMMEVLYRAQELLFQQRPKIKGRQASPSGTPPGQSELTAQLGSGRFRRTAA